MAKGFTHWTVLPHEPIEKLSSMLWRVRGLMPDGKTQRVMMVAKLGDGRGLVHNAIALEDELMQELEGFARPGILVVPAAFHRQDAFVWKQRYPQIQVLCPAGARKQVEKAVAVDGSYDAMPVDASVLLDHLDGTKQKEGYLLVRDETGSTLVFTDALCNLPKLGGLFGFLLAPTGVASVPRISRWLTVADKAAFCSHLLRLSETPDLRRIVVAHGSSIEDDPAGVLRKAAEAVG